MPENKLAIPIFVGGFVLFILVTSAGIFFVLNTKSTSSLLATNNTTINSTGINSTATNSTNTTKSTNTTVTIPVSSTTTTTSPTTSIQSAYTDGTYTVDAGYYVEGEYAQMKVSVTLASDKISSVTVSALASGESGRYQTRFASAISGYVVGKKIDSASLTTRVSGASVTSFAFNTALTKIKSQAKV